MQIEEMGELKRFETLPTEQILYISAVRYRGSDIWTGGPSATTKESVISMLGRHTGCEMARIYLVKLPLGDE